MEGKRNKTSKAKRKRSKRVEHPSSNNKTRSHRKARRHSVLRKIARHVKSLAKRLSRRRGSNYRLRRSHEQYYLIALVRHTKRKDNRGRSSKPDSRKGTDMKPRRNKHASPSHEMVLRSFHLLRIPHSLDDVIKANRRSSRTQSATKTSRPSSANSSRNSRQVNRKQGNIKTEKPKKKVKVVKKRAIRIEDLQPSNKKTSRDSLRNYCSSPTVMNPGRKRSHQTVKTNRSKQHSSSKNALRKCQESVNLRKAIERGKRRRR